ncbi:M48 family metallopeptidase [Yoonia sp.]|uniref:M48 family metallopeptidase n=1 Tax=Yoonia sp. TaxID=2212373 RepID=UPI00391B88C8
MGRHVLHGNPPIDVTLRKSAQARRLSLRISRLDGRVTLTMPQGALDREGIAFLREKESWLRGHLSQMLPAQQVTFGSVVPVHGRALHVVQGAGARVRLLDDRIEVPAHRNASAAIRARLRAMARDTLAGASDRHAATLGLTYSRLSIRDTRSRWGSCSSKGVLMYSWRLIMAPPAVLDYVAAHEVAHLREMNHAPAFWAIVAQLCPGYDAHRQWLRDHGESLHRMRFDD